MIELLLKEYACSLWNINMEILEKETRAHEYCFARYQLFYLFKENGFGSLKLIGQQFGNRDHSTIIHGIKAHHYFLENEDNNLKHKVYRDKFSKLQQYNEAIKAGNFSDTKQAETVIQGLNKSLDFIRTQALGLQEKIAEIQQLTFVNAS